ncbi:S8 family serine peptidase [bacterium]|nr:S8 family serine peptidase [candidate division CSSED10-310 bacterium]
MKRHDYELVKQHGITLFESLPDGRFVAWLEKELSSELYPVVDSTEIQPVETLEKLATTLEQYAGGPLQFGCWYITTSPYQDVADYMISTGAVIRSNERLYLTDSVAYNLLTGWVPDCDMLTEISYHPCIRWIYPLSESAGLEDEYTAQETVASFFRDEIKPGYWQTLENIGITGKNIKTGLIDTGFDTNQNQTCHPDCRGRLAAFIPYAGSPNFDAYGHGTHIGGIIAGNGNSLSAYGDGYLSGMGLAPESLLVVSNALSANPFPPSGGYSRMAFDVAYAGGTICNNSWWDQEGVGIGYTANCAIWDSAVRNAASNYESMMNLPVLVIFSAGNRGPEPQSLTSPKEAKNIITVTASTSQKSGDPFELWSIASHGPCADGRNAPDLTAPGIDIYSCWPGNSHLVQTGTSVACPHVTGAAALLTEYYRTTCDHHPSPALLKSTLIGLSEPVTQTIPDSGWGWGMLSLKNLPLRFPHWSFIDQTDVFTDSGQSEEYTIVSLDPDLPLDITLVWTDPPAAPEANPALVNNLDLLLSDGTDVYSGNNFQNVFTPPGIHEDAINNVERIRIANPIGTYILTVAAQNIAGNGIPGNNIDTDQDFAVFLNNAVFLSDTPKLFLDPSTVNCSDIIHVIVAGSSLSGNQRISLTASSDTSPAGIRFEAYEKQDSPGIFEGSLYTGFETTRPASLAAAHGDTIRVQYAGSPEWVCGTVDVDCCFPKVIDRQIIRIQADATTFRCVTDEPSKCSIAYRETNNSFQQQVSEPLFQKEHTITVTELSPCTWYDCFFTLTDASGNSGPEPDQSPIITWITDERVIIYANDFSSDPQWPQTDPDWEWGPGEGSGNPPDPIAGYTGSTFLGYNLTGNYENFLSPAHAVSPSLNCHIPGDYYLTYYRWLGVETVLFDEATIWVSFDENPYERIWSNPSHDLYDGEWIFQQLDVTDWASGATDFRFRFTMGPTDAVNTSCGWNIDDIALLADLPCVQSTPTPPHQHLAPSFVLSLNNSVFSPGDHLRLTAIITVPRGYESIGIATAAKTGSSYFFSPEWSETPDYSILTFNDYGTTSHLILDFTWPFTYIDPLKCTFYCVIFDPDTFALWDSIKSVSFTYQTDKVFD